jgi:hypothetical protein
MSYSSGQDLVRSSPARRRAGRLLRACLGVLVFSMVALRGEAAAQQPDTLRDRFIVPPPPPGLLAQGVVIRSTPGTSLGSPDAFGPRWGDVFVGAVAVNRQRWWPDEWSSRDGAVFAGFGLGDPIRYVGLEVVLASYTTLDSGFLTRAGVSVKAHRLLPGNFAVAAGMENVLARNVDGDRSIYGVISRAWLPLGTELPILMTSVGVGNGRFRSEKAWIADRDELGVFGSVSLSIWQPVTFIADYSQDLSLGVSVIPFARVPVSVTAGVLDVLERAGDGHRFMVGIAAGYSFIR